MRGLFGHRDVQGVVHSAEQFVQRGEVGVAAPLRGKARRPGLDDDAIVDASRMASLLRRISAASLRGRSAAPAR